MPTITRYATPASGRAFPPFSMAVRHGGTLYVSGLGPLDVQGRIHRADFAAQFAQVIENLKTVLADAGADMTRILKTSVLLVRATDVPEMNRLYAAAFPAEHMPARTTSVVAALPVPDFLLEIEAFVAVD
ncbi:RidA family protein [Roseococcus sp. SYP-B2431]|uniref:RidA family protein n=1 Tax=Roseococcus sp. SYP-B2431 TaxID=2496640 RepID=UPI00103CE6AC|nr:RidA family protein [Roseococcus sp. SYP-B2431]TCH97207.1 RidA family protein [Roseococcus sp. SYP-B2431]